MGEITQDKLSTEVRGTRARHCSDILGVLIKLRDGYQITYREKFSVSLAGS